MGSLVVKSRSYPSNPTENILGHENYQASVYLSDRRNQLLRFYCIIRMISRHEAMCILGFFTPSNQASSFFFLFFSFLSLLFFSSLHPFYSFFPFLSLSLSLSLLLRSFACLHAHRLDRSQDLTTVAPSSAGSKTFHIHLIPPSFSNTSIAAFAIPSKFSVASARIVGPAPLRQIPINPGWLDGVTVFRMVVRPGMRVER